MIPTTPSLNSLSQRLEQLTQDVAQLQRQVTLLKRVVVILAKRSKRDIGMSRGQSQATIRGNTLIKSPSEYIGYLQRVGLVDNAQKSWLYRSSIQEALRKHRRTMLKLS